MQREWFDSSIATTVMATTVDLYNQHLAGKPVGTVNLDVSCANGGTVGIRGTVTTLGDSGLTTLNLTFAMNECYSIRSYPGDWGTSVSSIRTTGMITKTGSFSAKSRDMNYQSSGDLALSGTLHMSLNSVTHLDPVISESCGLTARVDTAHVMGTYCGRSISH